MRHFTAWRSAITRADSRTPLCHTVPVSGLIKLLAVALVAASALTGCARAVDGRAVAGQRQVDQGYFFAGDVETYGQTLSPDDTAMLAYLRAIRRIDVCGLVTRDALAKIGEIIAFGTTYSFNECDLDVKVPGASSRKFLAVQLVMADPAQLQSDPCQRAFPLDLARLPGAPTLPGTVQPYVQVELIADADCDSVGRIADALARRLSTEELPPRDGLAAYPSSLAEQDPCAVMSVLGDRVDDWRFDDPQPYDCRFAVDGVALRLGLGPELVEYATEGRMPQQQDGVEVYIDPVYCSAVAFVGVRMQRKLPSGGSVDLYDLEIRPAVSVQSADRNCDVTQVVAGKAAELYD